MAQRKLRGGDPRSLMFHRSTLRVWPDRRLWSTPTCEPPGERPACLAERPHASKIVVPDSRAASAVCQNGTRILAQISRSQKLSGYKRCAGVQRRFFNSCHYHPPTTPHHSLPQQHLLEMSTTRKQTVETPVFVDPTITAKEKKDAGPVRASSILCSWRREV
jgi:hypothetical protein